MTMFSVNRKLLGQTLDGKVDKRFAAAATMRQVGSTCPKSCPLLPQRMGGLTPDHKHKCYAARSNVGYWAAKSPPEANDGQALRRFLNSLPMRHRVRHAVSGDVFGPDGQPDEAYIDGMVAGHRERPDLVGWGYSHGWRQLKAERFRVGPGGKDGGLVLNASCDSLDQIGEARAAGWDTVVVLPEGETRKRFVTDDGHEVISCVQQTTGGRVGCVACGLCMRRDRAFTIGFRPH